MNKISYYAFHTKPNKDGKKYFESNDMNEVIKYYLNVESRDQYISFGITMEGNEFKYGISSCDLFKRNEENNFNKINDYLSFYKTPDLKEVRDSIELLMKDITNKYSG